MSGKGKFVHLHLHTEYSLLDGHSKTKRLAEHIKKHNMDAVAITDHGVMHGAIEFYKRMKAEGVKPIIGMEAYTTNMDHTIRGEGKKIKNFHLLLLAKNMQGYKNLMKLTSIAHLEGFYRRPRFDRETLAKHAEGLICTSTCPQGELPQALIEGDYKKARNLAKWFYDVFGNDYYLEIQRHSYDEYAKSIDNADIRRDVLAMHESMEKVNRGVIKLSREMGIPLVATNDAHYVEKGDARAQDAMVCISTGKNIEDIKRLRFIDTPDYYVKSPKEMSELFSDLPDAIENTVKVADKCNLEIKLGTYFFPKVQLPKGQTAEEHFKQETLKGLKARYGKITAEVKERAKYEMDIIIGKEYAAYFLIYQDMARWAAGRGIPINTRGSVAGSIVSYALKITSVDPLYYDLPFERFLNPLRPSAPDIDLDIADDKREAMLRYLVKKYGKEKVAQICTFGRMLARGSVRDVARVMGYPYEVGDKISKLIPLGAQGFPMTIERALKESVELAQLYDTDSDTKKIIELSQQVEGSARHVSVHAAGVVVSPTTLTDFAPLLLSETGGVKKVVTQYEMNAVDDVGLVKLDVLGIRNLSILRGAVRLVKQTRGVKVNLEELPTDDKKTYEMLTRGETMGVFQLGGSGMTRFLVDLAPGRIEDLMAMIALYRPGPMANIPEYIERKKGKKFKYYHPKMENFLSKSYGILVYQDDLMSAALELAGYTWKTVDKLRKAVGKKIPEEMAIQHKIFVDGCMSESGMDKKKAEGLWALFEPFQGYGFNKAHAASYGMVAYQTAYMKANYPVEFMTALLTAESNDTEKIGIAVNECRRMGIEVLTPDINKSGVNFKVENSAESLGGDGIRFGLSAIKHVGKAAIEAMLEAREEGDFVSFVDFCQRVDGRRANKKVIEALTKVGAMGQFGTRAAILSSMDEIRSRMVKPKNVHKDQQGLFGAEEVESIRKEAVEVLVDIVEFDEAELQNLERTFLGFSLTGKPASEALGPLSVHSTHKISEILEGLNGKKEIKIAGLVSEVRAVVTKKTGAEMAFVRIQDGTDNINLVVFPKIYAETKALWVDQNPLLISGKVDAREDETSILVDVVETLESLKEKEGEASISIPSTTGAEELKKLKKLLLENPGQHRIKLLFESNGRIVVPKLKINWNSDLATKIGEILVE